MGITRHPTKVHLSTRIATADDRFTVSGMTLWVVDYTISERGKESSFSVAHAAEAAARRMVRNLLKDRLPGMTIEEVYTEELC